MGQEEDLCDDSVFIRAFDDAISKYKAMHGQTIYNTPAEDGEVRSGSEDNLFHAVDESQEPLNIWKEGNKEEFKGCLKVGEDEKSKSNNVTLEMGETTKMSPVRENISVESCVPISRADLSNALHVEETLKEPVNHSDLNSKGAEDYNQLLNQYYEIEEKRQKILEQLYQFGGWNYQDVSEGSGSGVQWGVSSTYQEHPVSASQTSQKHVLTSCCPSSYPISIGPENSSLADGDIINTAMNAAERALSSMKTRIPGDYDVNKEKERERHDGILPQSASSETDLAVVLNAWYSAGFYTGKYLVEQSYAKK